MTLQWKSKEGEQRQFADTTKNCTYWVFPANERWYLEKVKRTKKGSKSTCYGWYVDRNSAKVSAQRASFVEDE